MEAVYQSLLIMEEIKVTFDILASGASIMAIGFLMYQGSIMQKQLSLMNRNQTFQEQVFLAKNRGRLELIETETVSDGNNGDWFISFAVKEIPITDLRLLDESPTFQVESSTIYEQEKQLDPGRKISVYLKKIGDDNWHGGRLMAIQFRDLVSNQVWEQRLYYFGGDLFELTPARLL